MQRDSYPEFVFVFCSQILVHMYFWWDQSRCFYKLQVGVSYQLAGQPEERLLKVVVALGTAVIVLVIQIKEWFIDKFIKINKSAFLQHSLVSQHIFRNANANVN